MTRRRNISIIRGRFFPTNDLDQLPRQVLRAYDDETLLAAVMRVLFLEAEPLVGKLVADRLYQLPVGSALPKDFFTRYAQETLGKKDAHVSSRCCTAARVLGWTIMEKRKYYIVQQVPSETASLLILHQRYAPTLRVIDLKFLLKDEPTARPARELDLARKPLHTLRQRLPAHLHATAPSGVMTGTACEADARSQHAGAQKHAPS